VRLRWAPIVVEPSAAFHLVARLNRAGRGILGTGTSYLDVVQSSRRENVAKSKQSFTARQVHQRDMGICYIQAQTIVIMIS
jgi:translation elongation factor P/translation initiation factor 5A